MHVSLSTYHVFTRCFTKLVNQRKPTSKKIDRKKKIIEEEKKNKSYARINWNYMHAYELDRYKVGNKIDWIHKIQSHRVQCDWLWMAKNILQKNLNALKKWLIYVNAKIIWIVCSLSLFKTTTESHLHYNFSWSHADRNKFANRLLCI